MLNVLVAAAAATVTLPASKPDPAAISIPNLAVDTQKIDNPKKFFVFHRASTSFADALTDLTFCFKYVGLGLFNPPPKFVPWTEDNGLQKREEAGTYGLVGSLIGGAVTGGVERSVRQMNMTSCMVPRGYNRFAVSETAWRQLNGKDNDQSIVMQAKVASGPVPNTPRVAP